MLYQTKNPHGGDIYGREVKLDFSANTNPYGTPQGVLDAITAALPEIHRYPDPYCRKLLGAISRFENVPEEYILCGNGAAELIYAYCEAVKPKRAVELAPTFSEYALGAERTGCKMLRYILSVENDFTLTENFLKFLCETNPDTVFLCNPNNPTGKTVDEGLMRKILALCRVGNIRLFVDECFLDLCDTGSSLKTELTDNPNLFILKAFTKSYGMAGARLGYCLCGDKELLTQMSRSVQPWNVSTIAQAAGCAALDETGFLEQTRELIRRERKWLRQELTGFGFYVCDSKANYLLFHAPENLHEKLSRKGIAIRNCDNYFGLAPGWYRTAVRLHEENVMLVEAIRDYLG